MPEKRLKISSVTNKFPHFIVLLLLHDPAKDFGWDFRGRGFRHRLLTVGNNCLCRVLKISETFVTKTPDFFDISIFPLRGQKFPLQYMDQRTSQRIISRAGKNLDGDVETRDASSVVYQRCVGRQFLQINRKNWGPRVRTARSMIARPAAAASSNEDATLSPPY